MDSDFLAINLIVYIGEEIIILFCKQSIMNSFLKHILSNFVN